MALVVMVDYLYGEYLPNGARDNSRDNSTEGTEIQ